ncbi:MAG TPA: serine/threonine-protein kinase, partial [Pirellulales bacterium]|nr:serine/threonine-protein kinase [Pirellulales bacterium]
MIGRCCDLEWIGGGAMGDVYRGRQADMGNRTVAIKVPKAGTHRIAERFEREINASARLKHENIVCAYDRGEQLGRPFLVMEFVAGRVLRDLVEAEHPLSPRQLARILLGVARGLAHAAQQGIINRDLKPDNIMLASSGDETAKILDYGLALMADVDGPAFEVTRSGALLGTPGYLAPEQAADPHNVTIAADVYALGCTGFYSLTKQPPFSASSLDEMRRCHAERERPPLAEL